MSHSYPQARYCCESCGQPIDHAHIKEPVERDGVELISQRLRYKGQSVRLEFSQSEVLRALMLHGRRSTEALVMTLGSKSEAADTLISVHVSRLRGKLRHVGAPLEIKSVFGWGYELVPVP